MPTIYTCGHSTRKFSELVELLEAHGITVLVDVRAVPKSRFFPWFHRAYLEKHLPIAYHFLGDRLGGRNADLIPPDQFASGINELVALSETETVCIMCSERVPTPTKSRPEGCHRWYSLTPALEKKGGVKIEHI